MDLHEYSDIRHFDANTSGGKDYIVGDLHGCFDDLMRALKYLEFDYEKDRLFCVGDLIDRGPNSLDCALLVNQSWFYSVRGNHEQMMIDSVIGTDDPQLWIMNGGRWGYQQIVDNKERVALAELLNQLPYIITVGEGAERFNICHAEMVFSPDITDEQIDAYQVQSGAIGGSALRWGEPLIWGRDIIQGHPAPHTDKMSLTYVGHTPVMDEPILIGRQLYIDGGAVFGQKMYVADHQAKQIHVFAGNLHCAIDYDQLTVQESNVVQADEQLNRLFGG
jgi:serine/threonine protein phosphatase 1